MSREDVKKYATIIYKDLKSNYVTLKQQQRVTSILEGQYQYFVFYPKKLKSVGRREYIAGTATFIRDLDVFWHPSLLPANTVYKKGGYSMLYSDARRCCIISL